MKASSNLRAADYVRPKLPEERIERMWAAVARTQATRAPGRRFARASIAVALAAAVATVGVLFVLRQVPGAPPPRVEAPVANGATFTTATEGRQVTLPDGSLLALGTTTRLEVLRVMDDEIRLRLGHGALTCDVPRREGRRFVVEAGGTEIAVKGTRFTVELAPKTANTPALKVSVERGRVQVQRDERHVMATLDAGQQWASQRPPPPAASDRPATLDDAPKPMAPAAPPTAQELMLRANTARLAGRPAEAAREYDRLRLRFPGDARAGLAAFELARIRLTTLGDPRGAIEAFQFALAHNRGGFFAEDAEAGIVEAWHRTGDTQACTAAREAFLARHAKSPHAGRVKPLCR